MILLDENVPEAQRSQLRSWRIPVRQIGLDIAQKGISDDAIIPLLHALPRTTFFTRDLGFFRRSLAHPAYCLVCLDVGPDEAASFIRRFLRHPRFATQRRRLGIVVRISRRGLLMMSVRGLDEMLAW